jgi:hypothetical protein
MANKELFEQIKKKINGKNPNNIELNDDDYNKILDIIDNIINSEGDSESDVLFEFIDLYIGNNPKTPYMFLSALCKIKEDTKKQELKVGLQIIIKKILNKAKNNKIITKALQNNKSGNIIINNKNATIRPKSEDLNNKEEEATALHFIIREESDLMDLFLNKFIDWNVEYNAKQSILPNLLIYTLRLNFIKSIPDINILFMNQNLNLDFFKKSTITEHAMPINLIIRYYMGNYNIPQDFIWEIIVSLLDKNKSLFLNEENFLKIITTFNANILSKKVTKKKRPYKMIIFIVNLITDYKEKIKREKKESIFVNKKNTIIYFMTRVFYIFEDYEKNIYIDKFLDVIFDNSFVQYDNTMINIFLKNFKNIFYLEDNLDKLIQIIDIENIPDKLIEDTKTENTSNIDYILFYKKLLLSGKISGNEKELLYKVDNTIISPLLCQIYDNTENIITSIIQEENKDKKKIFASQKKMSMNLFLKCRIKYIYSLKNLEISSKFPFISQIRSFMTEFLLTNNIIIYNELIPEKQNISEDIINELKLCDFMDLLKNISYYNDISRNLIKNTFFEISNCFPISIYLTNPKSMNRDIKKISFVDDNLELPSNEVLDFFKQEDEFEKEHLQTGGISVNLYEAKNSINTKFQNLLTPKGIIFDDEEKKICDETFLTLYKLKNANLFVSSRDEHYTRDLQSLLFSKMNCDNSCMGVDMGGQLRQVVSNIVDGLYKRKIIEKKEYLNTKNKNFIMTILNFLILDKNIEYEPIQLLKERLNDTYSKEFEERKENIRNLLKEYLTIFDNSEISEYKNIPEVKSALQRIIMFRNEHNREKFVENISMCVSNLHFIFEKIKKHFVEEQKFEMEKNNNDNLIKTLDRLKIEMTGILKKNNEEKKIIEEQIKIFNKMNKLDEKLFYNLGNLLSSLIGQNIFRHTEVKLDIQFNSFIKYMIFTAFTNLNLIKLDLINIKKIDILMLFMRDKIKSEEINNNFYNYCYESGLEFLHYGNFELIPKKYDDETIDFRHALNNRFKDFLTGIIDYCMANHIDKTLFMRLIHNNLTMKEITSLEVVRKIRFPNPPPSFSEEFSNLIKTTIQNASEDQIKIFLKNLSGSVSLPQNNINIVFSYRIPDILFYHTCSISFDLNANLINIFSDFDNSIDIPQVNDIFQSMIGITNYENMYPTELQAERERNEREEELKRERGEEEKADEKNAGKEVIFICNLIKRETDANKKKQYITEIIQKNLEFKFFNPDFDVANFAAGGKIIEKNIKNKYKNKYEKYCNKILNY